MEEFTNVSGGLGCPITERKRQVCRLRDHFISFGEPGSLETLTMCFFTSYKTIGFVLGRELRTKERKERFVETNKSLNRSKDTVISSVHHIALNNDNQGDSKWSFGLVGHWAFLEGRLTIPKTSKTNCQDGWCVFVPYFTYIYIYIRIYICFLCDVEF